MCHTLCLILPSFYVLISQQYKVLTFSLLMNPEKDVIVLLINASQNKVKKYMMLLGPLK